MLLLTGLIYKEKVDENNKFLLSHYKPIRIAVLDTEDGVEEWLNEDDIDKLYHSDFNVDGMIKRIDGISFDLDKFTLGTHMALNIGTLLGRQYCYTKSYVAYRVLSDFIIEKVNNQLLSVFDITCMLELDDERLLLNGNSLWDNSGVKFIDKNMRSAISEDVIYTHDIQASKNSIAFFTPSIIPPYDFRFTKETIENKRLRENGAYDLVSVKSGELFRYNSRTHTFYRLSHADENYPKVTGDVNKLSGIEILIAPLYREALEIFKRYYPRIQSMHNTNISDIIGDKMALMNALVNYELKDRRVKLAERFNVLNIILTLTAYTGWLNIVAQIQDATTHDTHYVVLPQHLTLKWTEWS